MSQYIRLRNGLLIIEKDEILRVGHLNRWLTFADVKVITILRRIKDWIPVNDLSHFSDFDSATIKKVFNSLESLNFIERKSVQDIEVEFVISHFNEVGAHITTLLFQNGIKVSVLDERLAQFFDVRGSYIRISDVGIALSEILQAQTRELINSGNVDFVAPNGQVINRRRIVVITTYPEPELLARLMEAGIEYICALTTPFGAIIGPYVRPGASPCFHCIDRHRSERDDFWQEIATTLFLTRHEKIPLDRAYFTSAKLGALLLQIARGEIPHELISTQHGFAKTQSHDWLANGENERESGSWGFHPDCSCHWGHRPFNSR